MSEWVKFIEKFSIIPFLMIITGCISSSHSHHNSLPDHNGVQVAGSFEFDQRAFDVLPMSDHPFANGEDEFQFAIIADNTGGARPGVLENALEKINLLHPELVVSIGDLVEGFIEDYEAINQQWSAFDNMLGVLEMPFFYTAGNHDWSNDAMARVWEERYGASTYHFVYKNALFLVLNTEEDQPGGHAPGLTDEQLEYARATLRKNSDAQWTFVFMHQPLWAAKSAKGWEALQSELLGRDYTAFAGHMHIYDHQTSDHGHDHITLGTTGGYSLLRGKVYGEFDHVTWVSMTKGGPKIANLSLDGIDDKYVIPPEVKSVFQTGQTVAATPWQPELNSGPTITLTNAFQHPIEFAIEAPAHPDVRLLDVLPSGVIEPGQIVSHEVALEMLNADRISSPVRLKINARLLLDLAREIQWNTELKFLPVERAQIAPSPQAVSFDGRLDEWGNLRFKLPGLGRFEDGQPIELAEADFSAQFDASFDDDFLYLAVSISDDEVAIGKETDRHNHRDFVMVMIDPRPKETSAQNQGQVAELKAGKWAVMLGAPNETGGELLFNQFNPDDFAAKFQTHADGYTGEFRVPLSYLEAHQGEDWSSMRLNLALNDFDALSKNRLPVLLRWQPDWSENIVGTGLFEKQLD